MKRALPFLFAGLLLAPAAASAQLELGIDGGLTIDMYDVDGFDVDNLNTFAFPASWLRVGFGATEMISVETALSFQRLSQGDNSLTTIVLVPGVNVALGESGFYVRGEAGLQRISDEDDGVTQFTVGVAAGLKKAINEGPIAFRLEGGFGKVLEKENEALGYNRVRLLMGISATVN